MKLDPYVDNFDGVPDDELRRRMSLRGPGEKRYWNLVKELERRCDARADLFSNLGLEVTS